MQAVLLALVAAALMFGVVGAHAAGETISVEDTAPAEPLDPQASQFLRTDQLHFVTCEGLYGYADTAGTAGMVPQPDVAAGPPTISADGLTYTFTIRSGFGFSPPSTEQVTAASFLRAIQRLQTPAVSGNNAGFASDIANASASGSQLTIVFSSKPLQNVLTRLASPRFCPVPADAPMTSVASDTMATDGPYYVASADPTAHQWLLAQNPNYGGSRIRNLGKIVWTYGVGSATAEADVAAGTADYAPTLGNLDASQLQTQYGPGSPADADGHQQYFVNSAGLLGTVIFNTRPGHPLADESVRQAITCALDRTAWASQLGGPLATPANHFIMPGFPGFSAQSFCPIPTASVSAPIQLNGYFQSSRSAAATLLANELAPLGITLNATLEPSPAVFFSTVANNPTTWDITFFGWATNDPDAGDFLSPLFGTGGQQNVEGFSDATIDNELAAAEVMAPGAARDAAFAQADHDIAVAAPMAAVLSGGHGDFFSSRIGCQTYQPLYGMNLNLLCVRVADAVGAGATVSTGTDATADAPLQTAVQTPVAGTVSIQQGVTTSTTAGFSLLSQQLSITAPQASAAQPLRLTFTLDSSVLGGADPATVDVLRDGVPIGPCADSTGAANPDPCIASRTVLASGDLQLVVLSSHASRWNFGIVSPTRFAQAINDQLRSLGLPGPVADTLSKQLLRFIASPTAGKCSLVAQMIKAVQGAQSAGLISTSSARLLLTDLTILQIALKC